MTGGKSVIGVISDTHGLLRPEAVSALRGSCECIIHAGDAGKSAVLEELREIAPVVAVRGNVDRGAWADALPMTETLEKEGALIHILHDLNALDICPEANASWVIISGHSHQPKIENRAGALYLNPGSAGPRRFRLPVTLAMLELEFGCAPKARLVQLI